MQTITKSDGGVFWLLHLLIGMSLVSLASITAFQARAETKLLVLEPWVREAPPKMKIHAAYAELINKGTKNVVLVSAKSSDYQKVELHLSKVTNGIATMVKQQQISIPAKSSVKMVPGSFHFMLFYPKRSLKVGDEIQLSLEFADGSSKTFLAPVKKAPGMAHKHHHHMGH
ncbi:MAG: hypothetical protein CMM28_02875 [Rhodospirillaceae bacterium]|nr:hypothetical protein [Rhodospirillaceae bacterium]